MVQLLTGSRDFATSDASDGMALAICHAQLLGLRKGASGGARRKRFTLAESVGVTAEMLERGPLKR